MTVIADVEIGDGNLPNLRAAREAEKLVVVEERPIEERNYTGARGAELYESIEERAVVTEPASLLSTVAEVIGDEEMDDGDGGEGPSRD